MDKAKRILEFLFDRGSPLHKTPMSESVQKQISQLEQEIDSARTELDSSLTSTERKNAKKNLKQKQAQLAQVMINHEKGRIRKH